MATQEEIVEFIKKLAAEGPQVAPSYLQERVPALPPSAAVIADRVPQEFMPSVMRDEPGSDFLKSSVAMTVSPLAVLGAVYGDKLSEVLSGRQANRDRLAPDMTRRTANKLTTLDKDKLAKEIAVYLMQPGMGMRGAGGLRTYNPDAVVLSGRAKSPASRTNTVHHEMTHATPSADAESSAGAGFGIEYGFDVLDKQIAPNLQSENFNTGFMAAYDPDEHAAYITPIVRWYYQKTGKTIDDPQTARTALEQYYQENPPKDEVEFGVYQGLKMQDSTWQLLQTLAQNDAPQRVMG